MHGRLQSSRAAGIALFVVLVSLSLAGFSSPARSQAYTFNYAFPVGGIPYTLLAHSDGELWVGTSTGLRRYSRAGVLLGSVNTAIVSGLAETGNGDVFVCTYSGRQVRRYSAGGLLLGSWTVAGSHATRVALDDAGNLYVCEYVNGFSNGCIEKFSEAGTLLGSVPYAGPMNGIYAAPRDGGRMLTYSTDLQPVGGFATGGSYHEEVTVDRFGQLWLADVGTRTVRVFTDYGSLITAFGPAINGDGNVAPESIAVAPDGLLCVGDYTGNRVLVMTTGPTPTAASSWGRVKTLYR